MMVDKNDNLGSEFKFIGFKILDFNDEIYRPVLTTGSSPVPAKIVFGIYTDSEGYSSQLLFTFLFESSLK